MKTKIFTLSMIALVCFAGVVFGAEGHDHNGHNMPMMEKTVSATEVGNKICPISGEKVGGMGSAIQHEHDGKIYNFCCAGCVEEFKKNPEKYSKIAEESVHAEHEGSDHPQ